MYLYLMSVAMVSKMLYDVDFHKLTFSYTLHYQNEAESKKIVPRM